MRAFNEIQLYDFENDRKGNILREIQSKGKEYILKIEEQEFVDYLYQKYLLEPLKVYEETEHVGTPRVTKERINNEVYTRGSFETDVYSFTVSYQYTGSEELFRVHSNPWTMTSYDINLDSRSQKVSFIFKIFKQDPEEFKRIKSQCFRAAFANLEHINKNAIDFNRDLRESIIAAFNREKQKHLKENDFFAAINIKVNPDTESVFTAPTIKKKIIPQPSVPNGKEFSSEPTMSNDMYKDVLRVIYDAGKNMEKKPALYIGKDEEGLRDQFLFILETRYEGTTASGETFNRSGKTDIILKYAKDGSNLFVAECKFWYGASQFLNAISQLFGRYLTWRDSKVALIIFVKNKEFSKVLDTIKKDIITHELYVQEVGFRGETSFSYLFHLPQDHQKHVQFEVIAFHYDK